MIEEILASITKMGDTENKILEKVILASKLQNWQKTFERLKITEKSQGPITLVELEDPFSATCQAIFHLYTMNSIVSTSVNSAALFN